MIKNPAFIFSFVWMVTLWLYSLHYATILIPLQMETIIFILLSICFFSIPFLLIAKVNYIKNRNYVFCCNAENRVKKVIYFWLCFSLIEIAIFRFFPLFSLGTRRYSEWGMPGLHGLLNAMIIVLSNILFYKYLLYKKKKYLLSFFLCLCWPVLLLTRQVLMSMILQAGLIYLYSNKIKLTDIFKFSFICFVIVLLFGIVGDLRSLNGGGIESVMSDNYPSFLPKSFFWLYAYVTTPLNNLNYNINIYPSVNFEPQFAINGLLPSIVRPEGVSNTDFDLVKESLNVSTMHPQYLNAFGFIGSLLFYLFYGMFVLSIYRKFKTSNNSKWLFMLSALTCCLILSVFNDFLLRIFSIFQLLLHYYIGGTKHTKMIPIEKNNDTFVQS